MLGWLGVASKTDSDITDDEAGRMRVQLAAESKARKSKNAAQLAAENKEERHRMKNVRTRTDDDIMDEEAGRARLRLAAESKARKAAEAASLRAMSADDRRRVKKTGTRTDDDIMDEEAGRMRIEMAAASASRAKANAVRQAAENAALRNRMKSTAVRTDDDIMDEEAGRARLRLAAESKARKAAEEARIREENARNAERLKNTTTKTNDGGELFVKRSFSTFARKEPEPLMRESFMHASTFQKIAQLVTNLELGAQGREEKEQRRQQRSAADEARHQLVIERAAKSKTIRESIRQKKEMIKEAKQRSAAEGKQFLADRAQEHLLEAALEAEIVRARVMDAMSLDARLDNAEAKVDAEERADATAMKQACGPT